ncbi:beta-lactamase family protein [Ruminococcaceae bacterium OttesenSCG-928-I18]|nr:beta-lactamase family protein [Ruminococcaceae bacterium OttesenSCG-928-I18]
MSLSTQIKLFQTLQDFLTEEGKIALPSCSEAKPEYPADAPSGRALPRATPEQMGVDSHLLECFCRELSEAPDANAHSLLILRNDHVICEGDFSPYHKDIWHVCHSLSKSFIGTAAGIAVSEGLFHIDDPVVDYFPGSVGLLSRHRLKKLTIRHLLNMTSGISFNELSELVESDWLRGIFSSSLSHEPGTHFEYNSMNSYLLSALVSKTSGEPILEYLRPRLFEPLEFGPIAWEKCPSGVEKGGWGIYAKAEDLAKLGQLYLNLGHWTVGGQDCSILPERWVREATCPQAGDDREDYGYQMWVDRETGYPVMNGMFGQYIALIPPLKMVVVMTAGCPKLFKDTPAYHLLRKYFYSLPSLPDQLPQNPGSLASLRRTLHALHFRRPVPKAPRLQQRKPTISRGARWNSRLPVDDQRRFELSHFLNTTWYFPSNRAGLLPVIVQVMDNQLTCGVRALRMEEAAGGFTLFWEEGDTTLSLPVGCGAAREGSITVAEETFLTSCHAEIKNNEDDEAILCIKVCLLEHSSFRVLKLKRVGENLHLRLEEHPQISAALEMAMRRKGDGLAELGSGGASFGGFVRSNELLHYRITQFFSPEITGKPT